jgi:predicted permease
MGWRRYFRRAAWDAERAAEIDAHLAHHVDDLVARGLSADEARRAALRTFGRPDAVREEIYEMNSLPIVETLWRDLRFAVRLMRKTPGFTAATVLTLAVGIGANTAIFSVVDALLLRPLPYPQPDRLALVSTTYRSPRGEESGTSQDGRTWELVRDHATTFDAAVYSGWITGVNAVAHDRAAYVQQQRVGAGFFHVLGVTPLIGREFRPEEDVPDGPPVAVLSYAFWTHAFDADPSVVGRSLLLRGEPYTVVGVMPRGFLSTAKADVWTPLRPSTKGEGGGTNYGIAVRLKPGVAWPQANAELEAIGRERAAEYHNSSNVTVTFGLEPMQAGLSSDVRAPLLLLWGAVGLVLLIVCANVAGLMLARAGRRTREIATRMALGSGRTAVVRQLLVESAALALAGAAVGVGLGYAALGGLLWFAADYGIWQPVAIDGRVLVVTLGVALAASVLFGLAPALTASRLDVTAALTQTTTRGATGRAAHWPRRLLVAGEVAVGVLLVVSSALLVRTFVNLRDLDPGIDPRGVVTATFSMQDQRYATSAAMNQFYDATLERIRQRPGVEAAGIVLGLPYTRLLNLGFKYVSQPDDGQYKITNLCYVTPGYFDALKQPILRGRGITAADRAGTLPVAVVSEAFVRMYFKGRDPLGQRIAVAGGDAGREIVGITGDTQQRFSGVGQFAPLKPTATVYIPARQTSDQLLGLVHTWFEPSFVVRSATPAAETVADVRQAVQETDPLLPIAAVNDLDELQDAALAPQRFLMTLITALGAIAAFLAIVGIHGLVAGSVVERTRELGIRLALGATAAQGVGAVAVPGLVLALAGIAAGSALAVWAGSVLRSFLWGVSATDPETFVAVGAGVLLVAAAASLAPALRVLRLDPAQTLRHE